ncbi:hypothetical protein G6F59_014904 [Rhizopus arrhizus]|nr:hypothetical protein G6F59_014904 [Rhizopus arrhizus]
MGRRLVGDAPEHAQPLDGIEEFLEIDRLDHESIHAQFVAAHQILFLAGGSQHHQRGTAQLRVATHLLQNLQAVHLGQLQVQQHHHRATVVGAGELALAAQVVQRFGAVAYMDDIVQQLAARQRGQCQLGILGAVLDEEDRPQVPHG